MFDVAHLALQGTGARNTRYGVGGGLQIDIVMARFELGYMAALIGYQAMLEEALLAG